MFVGRRFVSEAGAGTACGIAAVWALLMPIWSQDA
jgi:hypothetical protein